MFLDAIDSFLIGKPDQPAKYKIELPPEKAFGQRSSSLIQRIPMKLFIEHKINPIPGVSFNFDGRMGKILTVSGGRVMVDFNNPIAGKDVVYDISFKKRVTDLKEQIKAFNEFLFRKDLNSEIEGKKLIIRADKKMKPAIEMFKDKYKDLFDLDLEVLEEEEKGEK
jgi:FKBP-type peptidyl-prolyl cis-trans isomerase 2